MTLYLHIGYGKTATTTIQSFFRKNAEHFKNEGLLWSEEVWQEYDADNNTLLKTAYGTVALPWYLSLEVYNDLKERLDLPELSNFYNTVLEKRHVDLGDFFTRLALEQDNYKNIILSSEDFVSFPYALFFPTPISSEIYKALRDEFVIRLKSCLSAFDDIKIVVSVRRQDKFLESGYNQVVSSVLRYEETIDEYETFHKDALDYAENLIKWEDIFGKGTVTVLPFEPDFMPDGPLAAFCKAIDLNVDLDKYESAKVHANYSASHDLLAEKLYFNRSSNKFSINTQKEMQRLYYRKIGVQKKSGVRLYASQKRAEILKRFEVSNRQTAKSFFNDKPIFNLDSPPDPIDNTAFIYDKNYKSDKRNFYTLKLHMKAIVAKNIRWIDFTYRVLCYLKKMLKKTGLL